MADSDGDEAMTVAKKKAISMEVGYYCEDIDIAKPFAMLTSSPN